MRGVCSEWVLRMVMPFADTHESDDEARRALPARLGLYALTLGSFVSLTTAGRLAPGHLLGTAVMWSFLPALQFLATVSGIAAGRSRARRAATFSRLLTGMGPWFAWLLALAGICLFARDVAGVLFRLLSNGALPVSLVVAATWSIVTTAGTMYAACDRDRRRAIVATLAYYAVFVGAVVLWYVLNGDLLPLFGVLS